MFCPTKKVHGAHSKALVEGLASSSLYWCTQLAALSSSTGSSADGPRMALRCSGVREDCTSWVTGHSKVTTRVIAHRHLLEHYSLDSHLLMDLLSK